MMKEKGIIIKSTGSFYTVELENKSIVEARLKGKFRLDGIRTTNPLAVGDVVITSQETHDEKYIISELLPRRNYIIRKSNKLSSQAQILASNIDLACLVISLVEPRTSSGFIDRFILCCEAYHIPVLLLFNKIDIYGMEGYEAYAEMYKKVGYKCLPVSGTKSLGIEELQQFLQHKTTLFSGHSGVGKSTLINHLIPGLTLKTGIISDYSGKGKHTTTFAEMHQLPLGGKIIDTPGIRDFGIIDINKNETGHYFPEIRKYMHQCKFNNCIHVNEPGCAVIAAVEEGAIDAERYYNYLSILRNEDIMN